MASDLPLRCACGSVRGVLRGASAARGNRLVCYCDDCQAFARHLGAADRVLDAHGGTDIFQTSPARVELTRGREHLACVRLRPGGLLRWYAACCRTPIGNTPASRRLPLVGLVHVFVDPDGEAGPRDATLGPVRGGVFGRFATGDRSRIDAHDRVSPGMVLRFAKLILPARLRGDAARSPFLDPSSGEPVVVPHVLGAAELALAQGARGA